MILQNRYTYKIGRIVIADASNQQKKCNGTCESPHECESNDGSCLNAWDDNSNWKNCMGKCIPKEDLCDGECVNPMCKQDGKCVSMFESVTEEGLPGLKNCNGSCMKATEKCEGKCEEYQCEAKDGSCQSSDGSESWQSCRGNCIPLNEPCGGECPYEGQCVHDGKCTEMIQVSGENEEEKYTHVWKSCDGACLDVTKKCKGKCETDQCETKAGK